MNSLKIEFGKLNVYTYICIVNLETAIKSTHFRTLKHKAGLNILYTAWWLKTIMATELKKFGLTHEQFNVLRILKGKHPEQMCVRDIAGRMIEKSSNVPRIIDRLETKKMVKRNNSALDKRETVITITEVGLHILKMSSQDIDTVFNATIPLSEEKAGMLNELLEQFRERE